ncbi:hypothetical protein RUND412_001774 [Rhizina undulata]
MSDKYANTSLDINNIFAVKGFVCLVTGGGTGIGLMITQTLARNGARVYITGRRKERLDMVVREYGEGSNGGQIIAMPCDITDKGAVEKLAKEIAHQEAKGINLLVNNAGISVDETTKYGDNPPDLSNADQVYSRLWKSDPNAWAQTFQTNVTAHYFVSVAFLPHLVKGCESIVGHSPSIINIASVCGVMKTGCHGEFAYSCSKAAMIHLTRMLASTFAQLKVRVNCIAPGLFPSEMTARKPADEKGKSQLEGNWEKWTPCGRPGNESDIGAAVLYLASLGGVFVNNQVLYPDGGLTLTRPSIN